MLLDDLSDQLFNFYQNNHNDINIPSRVNLDYFKPRRLFFQQRRENVRSALHQTDGTHLSERDGKWQIFLDNQKTDQNGLTLHDKMHLLLIMWADKFLLLQDQQDTDYFLFFPFKSSGNLTNPTAPSRNQGVTILYTSVETREYFIKNFRDHFNIKRTLYWKSNSMTRANNYYRRGQRVSEAQSPYRQPQSALSDSDSD